MTGKEMLMAAKPKLKTDMLEAENVEVQAVVDAEIVDQGADGESGLAVLEALPSPEAKEWLGRVKRVVEEALTRQSRRMVEREGLIREQSETISRVSLELRHHQEIAEKERELFEETNRRMRATNQNMRSALEERDRRLVVFARKLSRLRKDREGRAASRLEIIEDLKNLKWYQRAERKALLTALETLSQ